MRKIRFLPLFCVILMVCASCAAEKEHKTPPELDAVISAAIIENNSDKYYTAEFETESHTVIGIEREGSRITVYLTLTYRGYASKDEGGYKLCAGGYYPAALTFSQSGDTYVLKDFWTPESGTEYETSIKEKFPEKLWKEAFDKAAFSTSQIDECNAKADAFFATLIAHENNKNSSV